MSETEALRATILQEAEGYGSKRRFGLFSSPIPVAIGDDGAYKTKLRNLYFSQIPEMKLENLLPRPEASTRTQIDRGSSKNHSSEISTLLQQVQNTMSMWTLAANYCKFRMKLSRKVSQNNRPSSLDQGSRKLLFILMSTRKKTTLRRTPRGIEKKMAR